MAEYNDYDISTHHSLYVRVS